MKKNKQMYYSQKTKIKMARIQKCKRIRIIGFQPSTSPAITTMMITV